MLDLMKMRYAHSTSERRRVAVGKVLARRRTGGRPPSPGGREATGVLHG